MRHLSTIVHVYCNHPQSVKYLNQILQVKKMIKDQAYSKIINHITRSSIFCFSYLFFNKSMKVIWLLN